MLNLYPYTTLFRSHVDFEEIERGWSMLPAQILEGCDRHGNGLRRLSELRLRRARMAFDHGREAMEVVHEIKGGLAHRRADKSLDVAIARPHRSGETRQPGIGLDRDAVPALEIERERRVVVDGVTGSDVDVEPLPVASEAAHEVQILKALRIGDSPRGHDSYPRWGGGSLGARPHPGHESVICPTHRGCAACAPPVPCSWHRSAAKI